MKGDVFIVDDNLNNLELLEKLLSENNYRVRMANSGKRALRAIRTELPELIMLDINMPEMDGYQVCQELKSTPQTQNIPIIFISALDDTLDKVKAFKLGAVDYVTKPFQIEEVLARIENQLVISRLRKELEERNSKLITKNEELKRKNEELINSYERASKIFSALSEVLPGTVLDGKYRLEEKIGSGGFGSVYKSVHLALNNLVAIKVFCPTNNTTHIDLERFRLEGVSSCQVNHSNAISIYDFSISSTGIAYLVMELLKGISLADKLKQKKCLSLNQCLEIAVPICQVLAKAHSAGIIHRDIKPENIFLHKSDNGEIVKVLDFGIAKLLGEKTDLDRLDTTGLVLGTPMYLSPERITGEPYDGRSDIYSLGVVLYQMLTGVLPFIVKQNNLASLIYMHMTQSPVALRELNPIIPEAMEALVMETLSKEPEKRPTAQQLEAALIDMQFQLEGMIIDITKENTQTLNPSFVLETLEIQSTQAINQDTSEINTQKTEFQATRSMLDESHKSHS
ncbi:MAG: protein kinase domain-containing protein [bacterium]|nr:MAG: protein kinase domain-containing protein [bacterium]